MALLGIECGATTSRAILQWESKEEVFHFNPTNFKILRDGELERILQELKAKVEGHLGATGALDKIAIGLGGVTTTEDRATLKSIVEKIWPNLSGIWVGNDIEIGFNCLTDDPTANFKCLIISGTGSVCYGKNNNSNQFEPVKVGGLGHILGDRGSGYSIGYNALRHSIRQWEHQGQSPLLQAILKHLNFSTISDLAAWSVTSPKSAIASLCPVVAREWTEHSDNLATEIMIGAIHELGADLQQLLSKLNATESDKILIGLTGGLFINCEAFRVAMSKYLENKLRFNFQLRVVKESFRGALGFLQKDQKATITYRIRETHTRTDEEKALRALILPTQTALSPTEERHPGSKALSKMLTIEAIELVCKEDRSIYTEIRREAGKISQLIQKTTKAFKNGGRLFYVGAGTSGQMGILDASEFCPTFNAPAHWVQGIIAGGSRAVFSLIEGAEDSAVSGAHALQTRGVTNKDVVLGIAASGRTPFVWGALHEAKTNCKAFTCLLTYNPNIIPKFELDMIITINVGPEILTGSTRLKCGTATKTVLNMLTTLSMVKYGKCLENLMVDLLPCSDKHKDRAGRIVMTILEEHHLPDLKREDVDRALEECDYDIKKVVSDYRATIPMEEEEE